MKMVVNLITALAATAILANSADAQTRRTKEVRIQTHKLSRNVSRNPLMLKHNCHWESGETDPDPRIRLQLVRDCREHENNEAE